MDSSVDIEGTLDIGGTLIVDTFAEAFRRDFPGHRLQLGGFDGDLLERATEVLLSPGVDPAVSQISAAAARGARVYGDIELFWCEAKAPILAITGTNAKSTVTTLVGLMAATSGVRSGCGGNLGQQCHDSYVRAAWT